MDQRLVDFYAGTNYHSYEYFCPTREGNTWTFRVWAPKAKRVSIVGDFNNWDKGANPMSYSDGVWSTTIDGLKQYDNYKYCVLGADKVERLKADPFATHAETSPSTASKVYDISGYTWRDSEWLEARRNTGDIRRKPINIYEVHIGSWKRYPNGAPYNYVKFGHEIVKYCKKMHYTHIELLPITEYPYEGSWGYQVTGMFAPTSRYGTPHDFMEMIDICHEAGIGVILDWVSAHFPKDEHGLYKFDGTAQYEYSDPLKAEHKDWGTMIYDYSKNEVKSFLISSANYFFDKYHIDGIRMDAVASMLYLDYGRKAGEWRPNIGGGNYNLEAIDYIKALNSSILGTYTGAMMIAEESTAFPLVTAPAYDGGLGFSFKWNMGWMNDNLEYLKTDPYFRKYNHNKMTFSITYCFSENYILPLSHDEVVHGKLSLLNRVPGEYEDKFKGYMTFLGFYMAHPGKKLLFMGGDIGQFIEWDEKREIDWLLLDYDNHRRVQAFVRDLNKLYVSSPSLYETDCDYFGFKWLVVDDSSQNVFAFVRKDTTDKEIIMIANFSPVERKNYRIGVKKSSYTVALTNDSEIYGGSGVVADKYHADKIPSHGYDKSIEIDIPGNTVIFLK